MLGSDRMETTSTELTPIWRRNDIEKSTFKTHRYFADFESQIHVEISTSDQFKNVHVGSRFKFDDISVNYSRGDWQRCVHWGCVISYALPF